MRRPSAGSTLIRRIERVAWRLALVPLACHLAVSARAASAASASLTVPIVLSSSGLAGSFYTSELSLTNRGTTAATIRYTYTAAFGGGGGTATDTLAAGRQKTVPDAVDYLISIGLEIPASGNRGGVLGVEFTGLSSPDAGAATVRTTSAVGGGRAGLSYPAVGAGLEGPAYLCGLRQNQVDRANVALLHAGAAGAGDIVLRLTAFSGDPAVPVAHVFPDLKLSPGAFRQLTEILKDAALDKGYVRVERVSGSAPYYAYATILDQTTSDASFVPLLSEDAVYESNVLTLPVVVETPVFATEVVLTNVSKAPRTVRLAYVADAIGTGDSTASVSITLAAREQKVIPAFVQYLRNQAVPGVGGPGATFAGALYLTAPGAETGGIFMGGRTQTSGTGRYGLFYTAMAKGTTATSAAWLHGLQQNRENRTNLALVNTGETDSTTIGLHVDLFDGDTGSIARSFDVTLAPRRWTQLNNVLAPGIANGYARVSRTSGTNSFIAYAVVVDGGEPGSRSDDGAFVVAQLEEPPPSAELLAIRKVEARCVELGRLGLSRLELIRAVAATMATLPEYVETGVDEGSLTAYGVFANGRLHAVANNREFDAIPPALSPPGSVQGLAVAELPDSGYARLLQSFGQNALTQEPVGQLAAMLEDPGGYVIRVGKVGDARLTALRNVSGDGFFYINTHGARMWRTKNKAGAAVYSLQSSTPATEATDRQGEIAADLAAGRLTYFTGPTGEVDPITGKLWETRYGITGDFVKTYWQFAPHGIVFINVCWSAYTKDPAGPQEFIDACLAKGAGVYFGWNEKANAGTCFTAARYFVDRLIGANKFMKESPDQRAFPWDLVYQDMKKRGLTHDKVTGADLVPFPAPGSESVVLDPSIRNLVVDEREGTLKLLGYFGSTRGKVTVGGQPLPILSWDPDSIVGTLSLTGPGSNGDVVVEVPGELGRVRKSNVRQLTEWHVPLHYTTTDVRDYVIGAKGLRFEGTSTLRFRGDVGSYRKAPGTSPYFPTRGLYLTRDSSLRVTGSGSGSNGGCVVTLTGAGTFVAHTAGLGDLPLQLVAVLKMEADTGQGAIGLGFGATGVERPFTEEMCGSTAKPFPDFGPLQGEDFFPISQEDFTGTWSLPAFSVTVDVRFRILQRKFTGTTVDGGTVTVEWPDVEPISPPNLDTAQ